MWLLLKDDTSEQDLPSFPAQEGVAEIFFPELYKEGESHTRTIYQIVIKTEHTMREEKKKMKKGICQWSFPDTFSIRKCMELAKDAGFQGIELVIGEKPELSEESKSVARDLGTDVYRTPELNLKTPDEEVNKIGEIAREIKIEICSVASAIPFTYPLTSEKPEVREKGLNAVKRALKVTSILKAETFLLIPGLVTEKVSYFDAYQKAKKAISDLVPLAEKYSVDIGIENVWNKFLLSSVEFRDFIDEINSDFVGAYLDVANILVFGYPEQWVRILGKRIKKVHVKDFKCSIGNINGFTTLLAGDLNWPATMKALKEVGYEGYLVAEIIPPYRFYPERAICEISRSLDQIISQS